MLFERSHRPLGTVLRSSPIVRYQDWRDRSFAGRPVLAAASALVVIGAVAVSLELFDDSVLMLPSAWLLLAVAVGALIGGWRIGILGAAAASGALWLVVTTSGGSAETPLGVGGVAQFFAAGCALSVVIGAIDRAVREIRKAARALARSERHAQNIARRLQRTLLPGAIPHIDGLQVAARYLPADASEVGGDFFDFFQRDDGRWYVQIGDVCGKGPPAASRALLARYTLRTAAMLDGDPLAMLHALNRAILAEGDDRYATAAVLRLQLNGTPSATIALGGHPQALLLRGTTVEPFGLPGTVLGLLDEIDVSCVGSQLRPGDRLFLYTDGVTDRAGAPMDEETLVKLLAELNDLPLARFAGELEHRLLSMPGGRDDIAFVVLGVADPDA